jgi:putative membrane protein
MRRPLLMLATCVALAAPAYAAAPRAFVIDAIKADNSEIMLGQMAKQQASSRNVRDFGQTLVTDHTQAKQQMSSVANELDVTLPTGPTDEAQKEQRKLSALQGPAFDREFVRYMIKDHKMDIGRFRWQTRTDRGPAGRMASQQLPTLEKHLHMAQSLARSETGRYSGSGR